MRDAEPLLRNGESRAETSASFLLWSAESTIYHQGQNRLLSKVKKKVQKLTSVTRDEIEGFVLQLNECRVCLCSTSSSADHQEENGLKKFHL